MNRLFSGMTTLAVLTLIILSGCQNRTLAGPTTAKLQATPVPGGSWNVGVNLNYSQESIWEDTLVGLEFKFEGGQIPVQNIIVYDLKTRTQKQIIKIPEGRMADAPAIYGNKIVFAAVDKSEYFRTSKPSKIEPAPNWDIFLFDLETSKMQQLTIEEHAQTSPRIFGNTVAWLDARNQPTNQYPLPFDIYALDLKTNKERRITTNSTVEGYTQLAISGNFVVWTDMRHADAEVTNHPSNAPDYNNEVYIYDLATNQERRLTTAQGNDQYPAIDGKRVVWLRQESYQKADVFMYDLENELETQISHGGYAYSNPSISGSRIVWTDASSSNGNTNNDVIVNGQLPGSVIVLFDLTTQKETLITPIEEWKVWLWPVIHGNHIVYIWSLPAGSFTYAISIL